MLSNKIEFASNKEYQTYRSDVSYWWPFIKELFGCHLQLSNINPSDIETGFNSTYPVFLLKEYVIKFYGHQKSWRTAFETESLAHLSLETDKGIRAPKILTKGYLFPKQDESWPYIISSRVPGKSWLDTTLSFSEKILIASEIGQQLLKIHSLKTDNRLQHDHEWGRLDFTAAAEKCILPNHLVRQVDSFIAGLDDFDRCLVNGDLVGMHVFIHEGHLSGLIDWGDASVTDRHYELGKLMDTFDWDKRLLKTVLDTANWPCDKNFSKQALGLSLYRQAVGLTQHSTFDVFYKLPDILPLSDIATLDELANTLFDV
ncbi:TPA: phosphotransferase [Legionella pneumophila]|nr:phosphotransferase [Legionella pneumophila]